MRRSTLRLSLLLTLPLCLSVIVPDQRGQRPQVVTEHRLTITGTVFQASGQPVSGAHVTLRSAAGISLEAITDVNGAFIFRHVVAESYSIAAATSALQSVPLRIAANNEMQPIRLVLTQAVTSKDELNGRSMAFSDEPNFVVSGVTDWTAVGGHGSDATLRTSEDLARATSALKAGKTSVNSAVGADEGKLRKALAANPASFGSNLALGEYYLGARNYRQALAPLQAASALNHERAEVHYDLALTCRGLNNLPQAKLHIERALALKESANYHRLAGELAEQQGDPYSAVQHMERATRIDASEENYFAWGSELLLHRAVLQATEIFQLGANKYPSSVRMQTGLGSALFAEAHYDQAAQRLCEASDLQPNEPAPYLLLGNINEAAPSPLPCVQERLARFSKLSPENPEANYLYGMSLLRRTGNQNHERAETLLNKAVKLNPGHAAALLQLGILAAARQQYAVAIDLYRRSIAADSALAEAHYRLAVAYDRTGQSAQAASERALHNSIKLRNAEAVEQQRRAVKQFLIVLQQPSTPISTN